jgi:hypothetical protein
MLDGGKCPAFIFWIVVPKFFMCFVEQIDIPDCCFWQSKACPFGFGQQLREVMFEFILKLLGAHTVVGKKRNEGKFNSVTEHKISRPRESGQFPREVVICPMELLGAMKVVNRSKGFWIAVHGLMSVGLGEKPY